jgi:DNA-binding transcriptional regulator YbjK
MIGDAVMAVLASAGGRGLTHRAVDRHLGWPEGTTSRYFRTRDALLTAGVNRLVDIDLAQLEVWEHEQLDRAQTTIEDIARIFRAAYESWTGPAAERQIARYELSLEGQRRRAVHAAIIAGRVRINESIGHLLGTAGCKERWTHATALVSYLDGLVHDRLLHPEVAAAPDKVEDLFLLSLRSC